MAPSAPLGIDHSFNQRTSSTRQRTSLFTVARAAHSKSLDLLSPPPPDMDTGSFNLAICCSCLVLSRSTSLCQRLTGSPARPPPVVPEIVSLSSIKPQPVSLLQHLHQPPPPFPVCQITLITYHTTLHHLRLFTYQPNHHVRLGNPPAPPGFHLW